VEQIESPGKLGSATRNACRAVPSVVELLLFGARPRDRIEAVKLEWTFLRGQPQGA
jgi:hypothetical protein